ncbi:GDSL lipase/acylhydrolase family protein [Phyllosticta citricarpa]|uniref:GDSL lipase/acylhydrolase family protein n=2 Tax=Phyllosticta TaxID=121621 RepID=A0ABR1M2G2_9PEZI
MLVPLIGTLFGTLLVSTVQAQTFPPPALPGTTSWDLKNFKSLVSFGNSYTDEGRLKYLEEHDGQVPPVGWIGPVRSDTYSGGQTWPRYVNYYTGANSYNYAVGGAVCSNKQVTRFYDKIKGPYPDVEGYEIPAFIADKNFKDPGTGAPVLDIPPEETVYSMWIGTNDVGANAFLTDSQAPDLTLVDYLQCVYNQFDRLYAEGGRYFVLMNLIPLQLSPLYAPPNKGGIGKSQNMTESSYRMKEQVNLLNNNAKFQTPYESLLARRYPGARWALFDMYSLITDIYVNPAAYLNGTAPLNVDSYITANMTMLPSDRDSYLWYDSLHPSEQTDRIIAREFVGVVRGGSKWGTYW